ncbi:MAG: putative glycine dehydrogenase (decarboxylating) subunit 1 [Fimbriimonadales bacterium]|nr:putative glycine dehydrogenase (decarboxylating) subunit 1 [Fimbriimonadales bacterium]
MRYIPHTDADRKEMLQTIGVSTIDELFEQIPGNLRVSGPLNIPESLDEHALLVELRKIGSANRSTSDLISFLGAGVYEHYVPSIVMELISRGEFLSAYTPYQPEVSQGYLQTIYEFQTMICEITGMEVANASMYDGATALSEAVIMASGLKHRSRILVAREVHPHYVQCVQTFARSVECQVEIVDTDKLVDTLDDTTACVAFQYPDFFGRAFNPRSLIDAAHRSGALAIAISDPVALGVLEPPGSFGADVVVGDCQSLGIPMGFGGPHAGYFAVKRELVRAIPGRIVGATHDSQGRRGFVMTLRTREQDIRREKATSNICTNQALMALCATVWMSALGKSGFRKVAETCAQNAHYAASQLCRIPGIRLRFPESPFVFEFAIDCGMNATQVRDKLMPEGFLAGAPLGKWFPDLQSCLLVAVTEVRTRDEIDRFVTEFAKVVS